MFTDSVSVAATAAVATSTPRVLCALSRAEWKLFFPGGLESCAPYEIEKYPEGTKPEAYDEVFRTLRPEVMVTSWSTPILPPKLLDVDGLAPRLICHTSGSVKKLVPRTYLERGGLVTNWGTLASQAVAEHALLLILASLRRQPEWPAVIAGKRQWQPSSVVTQTLYGKRVGIHGFGNVARALIALLRPFGVTITAWSGGVPAELYARLGVERCSGLEELFSGCDILVDCEALTPATQGSVTRAVLRKLPPGALFVNVGRGAIVDEKAMADLAQQGHLRLALDVFSDDPIRADSPLHEVDGVVLSPHIAGPTSDQFVRCGELVARNLQAYFAGRPLEAEVTLEMYDRAT